MGNRVVVQHNGHVGGPKGTDRVKIWCTEGSDEMIPNFFFMNIMGEAVNDISGIETIVRSKRQDAHIEICFADPHNHEITTEEFIRIVNERLRNLTEAQEKQLHVVVEITSVMATNSEVREYYGDRV